MSTAKAVIESLPTPQLRGLPTRKAATAERVFENSGTWQPLWLDEAESLDHDNGLAECLSTFENSQP
jgi:hypothetical protein